MSEHRPRGYIKDDHDISKDPRMHLRFGTTSVMPIPSEYSMEDLVTGTGGLGVDNQQTMSACVGYALANGLDLHLRANKIVAPRASPLAVYTYARVVQAQDDGKSVVEEPLVDVGCQPTDAARGMARWGVASRDVWPPDPARVNALPSLQEDLAASAFRVQGWHRIFSTGPQRLAEIRLAISTNCPVAIGVQIDQAFENYSGSGAVQPSNLAQLLGGHMLLLVGYQRDGTLRGLNWWTKNWGDGGLFTANPLWATDASVGDVIVLTGELTPQGVATSPEAA
jgi:hypothetical protein